MKKKARLVMLVAIGSIGLLASCHNDPSSPTLPSGNGSGTGGSNTSTPGPVSNSYYLQFKGQEVVSGSTVDVDVHDQTAKLFAYLDDGNEASVTYSSSDDKVIKIDANSGMMDVLKAGTATITVTNSDDETQTVTFNAVDTVTASGAQSYASASFEEKANILGVLEDYAVENYLTGITLFSNGGYVVYNSRYVPTPSTYVSGYGWGTMKEGKLTKDSDDTTTGHPNYYHSGTVSLFSHANAMDASGSDVSDLSSYLTASYYSTRLNATNDGYEWYPSLATQEAPVAVDDEGNIIDTNDGTLNRRWRIYVRTGDNAPVYRTASTMSNILSFNKRKVVLEDYLTPFRFMLTNYNGQYRGTELTDGISGITDASSYFNQTSHAPSNGALYDSATWNAVMGNSDSADKLNADGERGSLITGTDSTGDYIEFNLLAPCTQFYAMYYLSSSLYSPLPMDFIKEWGANGLGKSPNGRTPVDSWLSVGPYYIQQWSSGKQISLARNDDFYEYKEGFTLNDGTTRRQPYQIPGFDFVACEDASALQSRFETGVIDSYAPDKNTLDEYSSGSGHTNLVDWNRFQTEGDGTFKLNVNAMTQEQWDERFGPNGSVLAHTGERWECKPYMSNYHFLDFLSFSLDRQTICANRGTQPTQDYFSNNYLIDPVNGISYNSTDAHKAVLADRYNSTYGYNLDAAYDALREAITGEGGFNEMASKGLLHAGSGANPGTRENPWLITIDMYWMNTDDVLNYGDVFNSIETAFKTLVDEEFAGMFKLDIQQHPGEGDYNAVYDRMKEGMFDLGFGAITGNDLNPVNFMEVLKSDNSSDFTLNWGPDTSKKSDDIVYDGKTWSYDALWQAADTVAAVSNDGELAQLDNISTGALIAGTSERYQSISGNSSANGEATYRLSLDTLIQGGAIRNTIIIAVNNGSHSVEYGIDDLNLDSNNAFTLTIGSEFNTTEVDDENSGVVTTVESPVVSVIVTFQITVGDMTYDSSSSISLSSWYGIHSAND